MWVPSQKSQPVVIQLHPGKCFFSLQDIERTLDACTYWPIIHMFHPASCDAVIPAGIGQEFAWYHCNAWDPRGPFCRYTFHHDSSTLNVEVEKLHVVNYRNFINNNNITIKVGWCGSDRTPVFHWNFLLGLVGSVPCLGSEQSSHSC